MMNFRSIRSLGLGKLPLVWLVACLAGAGWLLSMGASPKPEHARKLHTKAIEDIKVGDSVLAKDAGEMGPPTPHRVVALPRNWTEHVVHISVAGGGELQATRAHPIWVKGRGWTDAADLHPGDRLEDANGRAVTVADVVVENRTVSTFNLTVDGVHTYYALAGEMPILVHNVNVYPDPEQPGYSNGASNLDHTRARSLGGGNGRSNLQSLPAETNFRKGGYEGQLNKDWTYYKNNGLTDAEIESVLGDEIKSLGNSPPPRPTSNDVLSKLPCK